MKNKLFLLKLVLADCTGTAEPSADLCRGLCSHNETAWEAVEYTWGDMCARIGIKTRVPYYYSFIAQLCESCIVDA